MTNSIAESPTASGRNATFLTVALLALVLVLTALTVVLAVELRDATDQPGRGLTAGSPLPPLTGLTPEGRPTEISYGDSGRPTVVYYFSPACGWCERNWANVRTLRSATAQRYRWVGVSATTTEDLAAFATARGLDFEIVTNVTADIERSYQFVGTPATVVVDTSGRVLQHWIGAYTEPTAHLVEAFFGTRLPGLATASSADPSDVR